MGRIYDDCVKMHYEAKMRAKHGGVDQPASAQDLAQALDSRTDHHYREQLLSGSFCLEVEEERSASVVSLGDSSE